MSVSHRSGAADTSPPGSSGTWAKGERSSAHLLNRSGRPNSSISVPAARTPPVPERGEQGRRPDERRHPSQHPDGWQSREGGQHAR